MSYGITREQAFDLVAASLKNANLVKHCLASEAVMRALAVHLREDPDKWGLAGLLHDLDAESMPELHRHTHEAAEILAKKGVDEEIIEAICLHNEAAHTRKRTSRFEHALAAGETITGLIIATALVYPDRKLTSVKARSIRKRMKEKQFAAGANRAIILECEQIDIPLADFCELCLAAMQGISDDLGL